MRQIRYLITSHELVAGARLPPVRDLATELGVNAGTIALAYRTLQQEGLVAARRGRGTYVAALKGEGATTGLRQALLGVALDELIERAYALGFDASSVSSQLGARLQRQLRRVPLVLVMPTVAASEKYLGLVTRHLPSAVVPDFHATSVELLELGDPAALAAYRKAYFTVTFSALVPRVDAALRRHSLRSEVVGLTAQLTAGAKARLAALRHDAKPVLVTETRNVGSALALLAQHSPLVVREVPVLTEDSGREQFDRHAGSTHVYTFGVVGLLDSHAVPAQNRLEMEFTLSEEATHQLHALLDHPRLGAPTPGDPT